MYSQIEDALEGKRLSSSSSFNIPCYNIFMSSEFGKFLIVVGIALVLVGLVVLFRVQTPWVGRLPGDIWVKKESFSFYFPITTCILVSIVLTFVFYIFRR